MEFRAGQCIKTFLHLNAISYAFSSTGTIILVPLGPIIFILLGPLILVLLGPFAHKCH